MRDDISEVGLGENEVDVKGLVCLLHLYRHHRSCILLPLRSGESSSREASLNGVNLAMNGHLVPLITPWCCQRLNPLWLLKIVLQETVLHQFVQLVP